MGICHVILNTFCILKWCVVLLKIKCIGVHTDTYIYHCCCSAEKSGPTLFSPHGLQHTRLPCPSQSPRVCSNTCLLSQWRHPTVSSSVAPFSSCPQSFPAPGAFPMSWLFANFRWLKYSNENSGPISFRMDWLDLLAAQGTPKSLLQHLNLKTSVLWCSV